MERSGLSRSIRDDRPDHQQLSLVRQCILLDVSRASVTGRYRLVDGPDGKPPSTAGHIW